MIMFDTSDPLTCLRALLKLYLADYLPFSDFSHAFAVGFLVKFMDTDNRALDCLINQIEGCRAAYDMGVATEDDIRNRLATL